MKIARTPEEAAALLHALRKEAGLTLAAVAVVLGVKAPTVCEWERQTKRPRDHHRTRIETWSGGWIPAASWVRSGEQRDVAPLAPSSPATPTPEH